MRGSSIRNIALNIGIFFAGELDWTAQTRPSQAWLHSVHMASDGQRGWAVGAERIILFTKDGGRDWQVQPSNTQLPLISIWMNEKAERGVAVGAGTILLTPI